MPQKYSYITTYDELTPNYTPIPRPTYQEPEPWYSQAFTLPNLVRMGGSTAGDILGGLGATAAAGTGVGAPLAPYIYGGTSYLFGAGSELTAELMEGKPPNWPLVWTEGGLNLMPGPNIPGRGAGLLELGKYAGKSGGYGAAQGIAGYIPRRIAEHGMWDDEGRLDLGTGEDLFGQAAVGTVAGTGVGTGLAGGRRVLESIGHSMAAAPPLYQPKIGDYSPIPDQLKLPGMGGVDFQQRIPPNLYDKPVQSQVPGVDRARGQSALDTEHQQRIFELQVRQSEAQRAGDFGTADDLGREIARVRLEGPAPYEPSRITTYSEIANGEQFSLPNSRIGEGISHPPSTLGVPYQSTWRTGDTSPVPVRPQPTQGQLTYDQPMLPFPEPLPMERPPQVDTPLTPEVEPDYRQIPIQFRGPRGQFMNQPPPIVDESGQGSLPFDPNISYFGGVPRPSPFQPRMEDFANVPAPTRPPTPVQAAPIPPPVQVQSPVQAPSVPPVAPSNTQTGTHMVSTSEQASPGPRPPAGVEDDRPITISLPFPDMNAVRLLLNDGYVSIQGLTDANGDIMMVRADHAAAFGGKVEAETRSQTALRTRQMPPVAQAATVPPVARPEIPSAIPAGNVPIHPDQEIRVPIEKAKKKSYLTYMKAGGWVQVGQTETEAIFRRAPEVEPEKKPGLLSRLMKGADKAAGSDTGSTTIFNDFGEWVMDRFNRIVDELSPERKTELEDQWNRRVRALPAEIQVIKDETDVGNLLAMEQDYRRQVTQNQRAGDQDASDHSHQLMLATADRIDELQVVQSRVHDLEEITTDNDINNLTRLLNYWSRQMTSVRSTTEHANHAQQMVNAAQERIRNLSGPPTPVQPTDPDLLTIQAASTVQQAQDLVRYWTRHAQDISNDTSVRHHAASMRASAQDRMNELSVQAPANQPLPSNRTTVGRQASSGTSISTITGLPPAGISTSDPDWLRIRNSTNMQELRGLIRHWNEEAQGGSGNTAEDRVRAFGLSSEASNRFSELSQSPLSQPGGGQSFVGNAIASLVSSRSIPGSRGRMPNDSTVHVGKGSPEVELKKMQRLKKILHSVGVTSIPPLNPSRLTRNISHAWAKQQLSYVPDGNPGLEVIHAQAGTLRSDPYIHPQTYHIIYRDSQGTPVAMADVETKPNPAQNDTPVFAADIESPAYGVAMYNTVLEILKKGGITTHGSYSPHTARLVDRFRQALATEDLPVTGEPPGIVVSDIFNAWRVFKDGLPGLSENLKSSKAREMAEMVELMDIGGAPDGAYAPIVGGKGQPLTDGTKWRDTVLNQMEQLETTERVKLGQEVAEEVAQGIYPPKESPFVEVRNWARNFMNDETGSIVNPVDAAKTIKNWAGIGKGGAGSRRKTRDEGQLGESYLDEVLGLPKNATTWGDYSPTLKQALNFIHTKQFRDAIWPMIKGGWDISHWKKYDEQIRSKPMFQRSQDPETGKWSPSWAEQVNFKLLSIGDKIGERGELIGSTWIENGKFFGLPDNPVSKFYSQTVGRLTRGSNRSFALMLNHIGANRLEWMADRARDMAIEGVDTGKVSMGVMDAMFRTKTAVTPKEAMELNPYKNLVLGRDMADMVKTALGKAPLKGHFIIPHAAFEINLEAGAKWMSRVFFAPRLIFSRLRMLNPATYIMATPQVRKEYLKSGVAGMAMWLGMTKMLEMAAPAVTDGVDVSWDPDSADFGKIRIRNTRLDFGGGYIPYLVSLHRLWSGLFTSSSTQQSKRYGEGYQAQTQTGQVQRVGENKFDPLVKFAWDIGNASDYKPFHTMDRTAQLFIPLIAQDMWELLQKDPGLIGFATPAVLFGAGTQTYQKGESIAKFVPSHKDILLKGGGLRDLLPTPIRRTWDDTWRDIGIGGR